MIEIKERLALSARPGKLTLIREGMFLKCYQQSLFSLVHYVYPDIKVTGHRVKKLGGRVVFSGGFPEAVLVKVLPDASSCALVMSIASMITNCYVSKSHLNHRSRNYIADFQSPPPVLL